MGSTGGGVLQTTPIFIIKSKNKKIEQLLGCCYHFILLKGDFDVMKQTPK